MRWLLLSCALGPVLHAAPAQQPAAQQPALQQAANQQGGAAAPTSAAAAPAQTNAETEAPLPPIRDLLLQVERNERAAEAAQNDYTYRVHLEEQDLDSKGGVKKSTTTDAESLTIDGIRVDRVIARNGHPLTPEEAKKESERIDKDIAKAKENHAKHEEQEHGNQQTDANGDEVLSASRILELGAFTHPRRIELDGRPTIVVDYAGDPNAKTRTRFESVVRDLVGTVWIDEQDRVLVQAEGHFLRDFKVGGGLLADIKSGSSFEAHYTQVNHEVWLPGSIAAQGRMRILLLAGFSGRIHLVTSDYRKFRTSSTMIPSNRLIGPDGQPITPDTISPDSARPGTAAPGAPQPSTAPSAPGATPPSAAGPPNN